MQGTYVVAGGRVEYRGELRGEAYLIVLDEVDAATFEDLGHGYAKDARVVLIGPVPIEADAASFRAHSRTFAADQNRILHLGEPIDCDEDIDVATFEALGERYFRDARAVYCTRYGWDCYETIVVEGADPSSFEALGSSFGRDHGVLFNNGDVEEGATSPGTFEPFHPFFARDERRVYHLAFGGKHTDSVGLRPVEGADPGTFVVFNEHYARDAAGVFFYLNDPGDSALCELHQLHGVHANDFELVACLGPGGGRDRKRGLLYNCGQLELAVNDPLSFEGLSDGTARDRTGRYSLVREWRMFTGEQQYGLEVVAVRPLPQ